MSHFVFVQASGKNISVSPTRLWLTKDTGNQEVVWAPGNSVVIDLIEFTDPGAPIDPVKQLDGTWKGSFNTDTSTKIYKYNILIKGLQKLDPEIENGPGGMG